MIIQCYADDYLKACEKYTIKDTCMLEFGNEIIKNCLGVKGKLSAKQYWINKGIKQHISVDVNGRDGSINFDLRKDIIEAYPGFKNHFDICTNIGTLEHLEGKVYQGYKNIHNCCKVGGTLIYAGPPIGSCLNHAPNHYRLDFFGSLFYAMNYEEVVIQMRIPQDGRNKNLQDNLILFAICKKVEDGEFISEKEFNWIGGF